MFVNVSVTVNRITGVVVSLFKEHPAACIFLLAVSIRAVVLAFIPLPDQGGSDFPFYSDVALTFLSSGDFGSVAFIAPGFAFYLAFIYLLLGASALSVLSGQLVLGGVCAVLVYSIGKRIFSLDIARVAGLITALWPPLVLEVLAYGNSRLLYIVFFLAAILLFLKALTEHKKRYVFASGVFAGFAALTEPIAVYFPLLLLGWGAAFLIKKRTKLLASAKKGIPLFIIFCVGFVAVVGPWAYRNAIVFQDATHAVPIVVKQLETEVLSLEYLSETFLSFIRDRRAEPLSLAGHMIVVPHNLSVLAPDSQTSYKEAVMSYVRGERTASLRDLRFGVLGFKMFLTLLHLIMLALAVGAVLWGRGRGFGAFLVVATAYVLSALLILYAGAGFTLHNVSQAPNFYFAPLIPLCILLSVQGAYLLRMRFRRDVRSRSDAWS